MIDINSYKPFRSGQHPEFRSSENRCTHIGVNKNACDVRQFRVDGEVYLKTDTASRCDFLLLNDSKTDAYFIELKGSDLRKAIQQIESTIAEILPSIHNYTVYPRVIYHSGSHSIQDRAVISWKKRHQGRAVIKQMQYTDYL